MATFRPARIPAPHRPGPSASTRKQCLREVARINRHFNARVGKLMTPAQLRVLQKMAQGPATARFARQHGVNVRKVQQLNRARGQKIMRALLKLSQAG